MGMYKLCKCGKKIDYNLKRCLTCEGRMGQQKKEENRYYDKFKRNKEADEYYHSKEWKEVREAVLNKYHGIDLYAYFVEHVYVPANTVHHIVELTEDWDKREDIANLIPLSDKGHKKIHKMYLRDKKRTQAMLYRILKEAEGKWR